MGAINRDEQAIPLWAEAHAELTGAAKRLVAGKRHDWVSHTGGVQDLMKHLRSCLGKPLVSDLTEHLNRYFKNSRRRANESMNDYITRKCEVYLRACQALQRVTPHHGDKGSQTDRSENAGGNSRRDELGLQCLNWGARDRYRGAGSGACAQHSRG